MAQEFTVIDTCSPGTAALQAVIRKFLDGILEPINVLVHSEDPIDER